MNSHHMARWAQYLEEMTKRPGYQNVKLFLRFTPFVDDTIRRRARMVGDISRFVDTAIRETNLLTVKITEDAPRRDAQIIVKLTPESNKKLRAAVKRRGCPIGLLTNSALTKWLADNPK